MHCLGRGRDRGTAQVELWQVGIQAAFYKAGGREGCILGRGYSCSLGMEAECTCEPQPQQGGRPIREPHELLASLRFILEGRGDRSGMNLGTRPGVAPEESQEAVSWAKVSLASPKRPHGGRSQEVLVAVPPQRGTLPGWHRYQALKVLGTHPLQAP